VTTPLHARSGARSESRPLPIMLGISTGSSKADARHPGARDRSGFENVGLDKRSERASLAACRLVLASR